MTVPQDGPENWPLSLLPGLPGPIPLNILGSGGLVHTFCLAAPELDDFLGIFPAHKSTIHPPMGMLFLFLSLFLQTTNFTLGKSLFGLLDFKLRLFLGRGGIERLAFHALVVQIVYLSFYSEGSWKDIISLGGLGGP